VTDLHDLEAERAVIGCAVSTRYGYTLAAHHGITADMFQHPTFRRIFETLPAIADEPGWSLASEEVRIRYAASAGSVNRSILEDLVDDRPVHVDAAASYAIRIHEAVDARRQAQLDERREADEVGEAMAFFDQQEA
jgi:hypothetical protein